MFVFNQLAMAYGGKLLFTDVSLKLFDNTRYALVGANGTGKSTLLELIAGQESPSAGTISIPKQATIGWLKQDQYRYEDSKILDVVLQGKLKLWEALVEKEQLLAATNWNENSAYRLAKVEEIIANLNGYTAESFAQTLLTGLGIGLDYHHQPLKSLSGGYKLRVLMAQTLFQEPDILLLDEPTNHLDIISIEWLENYLKKEFSGLLIFISHDMDFISHLAHYILDIDYGEIRQYSGQYAKYLAEKQLIEEQKLHEKKHMEEKIAVMQRFIERFRSSPSRAKQTQSRVKVIEKMILPDIKNSSRVAPSFQFKPIRQSGKQVLKVLGISKSYQQNRLFNHVNFDVRRGEKIVIIGANGVGKSTLIKTLLGIVQSDQGQYEWGYETRISYFSQDHHDLLKKPHSALEWISDQVSNCSSQQIRQVLGQVLFSKEDVNKDILTLSGGEAARLLLAKIMLEQGNVLILDEPTNHLDIDAIEALAEALNNYSGTLLLVSHNRHFISKIAKRILFISKEKGIIDFQGCFADFEKTHLLPQTRQ